MSIYGVSSKLLSTINRRCTNTRFGKIILHIAIFVFAMLPSVSFAQTNPLSSELIHGKVVLQLKWFHQFNFAGYYAAVEKGYYKEAGIDVVIKEGQPGMDFIDEVVSGRANYGIEMPELLIARHNGKPVVVLAAIFQHSPQILLARADNGIKSPHDLIGKSVMWRFDSAAELRAMLINENVSLDKVEFKELSWDINDLINGNVDALHAYVTDQPHNLERAEIPYITLSPINYGIDFYGDCLFTSDEELLNHPDRVRAFREASLRGWTYAMDHPIELMEIISKKYHSKSSLDYMQNEFEHINQLMFPKLVDIGYMNPGRWKHIGDTFANLGMIDQNFSLDGFLYNPAPESNSEEMLRVIWVLLGVMAAITLMTISLFFFNKKLKSEVAKRTRHLSSEIEERKQAELALRESEERLELALFSTNDGVWDWRLDTDTVIFDSRYYTMAGYKPNEFPSSFKEWEKRVHPDDIELANSKIKQYLDGNSDTFDVDFRFLRKDKSYFWIRSRGKIVEQDTKNKPTRFIGTHTNITERKQAEIDLRESENRYRTLFETSIDGICTVNPEGYFIDSNQAVNRILGYSNEELLQLRVQDIVYPDDQSKSQSYLAKLMKEGFYEGYEGRVVRKSGEIRYVEVSSAAIYIGDKFKGSNDVLRDVTDQKQAADAKRHFEKQLLQTQKLESLGVLAGGIAHDFNNILMGILGYADLALTDLDPIDPAREFVQGINDSTHKAAGLVKQMLAYSGKGKFSLEPIDLNHLIDDTVQMLEISISKNAILKFNYSDSPVFLEGDPSQIRQIIMNLVINASDAVGKKSGVIAVTTGSMYCDNDYIKATGFESQIAHTVEISEGMYSFVEISDTGSGMSDETIARIFEPFFTTKFTGRGLGLSAVLGIVRGHHGMVKIYSEEAKGTNFKVLFPLFESSDSSSVVDSLDAVAQDWRGEGAFLIADDEEAVRTVGKHMLQKLGFDVLTAEHGDEAITIFKEHREDIVGVLLDLTMPHKDGAEVFREIHKLKSEVKVILTSGYNEQDATQQFVGKGLAGFIQKPYVAKELVNKIAEVMDKT